MATAGRDILVYDLPGEPAVVFVNPGKERGRVAEARAVFEVADGESPGSADITATAGRNCSASRAGRNSAAGSALPRSTGRAPGQGRGFVRSRPAAPRTTRNIFATRTGLGVGDVNGDGRVDILSKDGWFEQPAEHRERHDLALSSRALRSGRGPRRGADARLRRRWRRPERRGHELRRPRLRAGLV